MNVRYQLVEYYMLDGNFSKVVEMGEPLLIEYPFDKEVYKLLIQSYGALGRATEAARVKQLMVENIIE